MSPDSQRFSCRVRLPGLTSLKLCAVFLCCIVVLDDYLGSWAIFRIVVSTELILSVRKYNQKKIGPADRGFILFGRLVTLVVLDVLFL